MGKSIDSNNYQSQTLVIGFKELSITYYLLPMNSNQLFPINLIYRLNMSNEITIDSF